MCKFCSSPLLVPYFLHSSVILASVYPLVILKVLSSMGKNKKTSRKPLKNVKAISSSNGPPSDGHLPAEQGLGGELSVQSVSTGKGKSTIGDAGKVFGEKPAFRYLNLDDVSSWWGYFLFGYFPNRFQGEAALLKMCNSWNVKYLYHPHSSGILVFGFETEKDMNTVLKGCPYYVYGKFLSLRVLPRCFELGYNAMNLMPIWINLPSLPLECWTDVGLFKIVSEIGKPIYVDTITRTRGKKSYARVLVYVDVAKELVRSVRVELSTGKTCVQEVVYEFETKFCSSCHMYGHLSVACGMKSQEVEHLADEVAAITVESKEKEAMKEELENCCNSTMVEGENNAKGKLAIQSGDKYLKYERIECAPLGIFEDGILNPW